MGSNERQAISSRVHGDIIRRPFGSEAPIDSQESYELAARRQLSRHRATHRLQQKKYNNNNNNGSSGKEAITYIRLVRVESHEKQKMFLPQGS